MEKLLQEALRGFQSLPVQEQRDILWQYVLYVEQVVINEVGDPFLFLEWYVEGQPDA